MRKHLFLQFSFQADAHAVTTSCRQNHRTQCSRLFLPSLVKYSNEISAEKNKLLLLQLNAFFGETDINFKQSTKNISSKEHYWSDMLITLACFNRVYAGF